MIGVIGLRSSCAATTRNASRASTASVKFRDLGDQARVMLTYILIGLIGSGRLQLVRGEAVRRGDA